MNVRMMPPQGPMGQPMPMGGAPAPMGGPPPPPMGGPMGGPMPVPPMQPTAGQQNKKGLGSTFGGNAQGRGQFKNFMSAKRQTSALVPQMQPSMQPMGSAPPMAQPSMAPQPMLPGPAPQMMGAMRPMGNAQVSMPIQAGRPMRGSQGGLGSAPVQLNMGGMVPQLSMGMAAGGPAVYLGDQRLSDPSDMHQKMLRAGYGRDDIMDSASGIRDAAMHIVEDTDEYLGGARGGFGHMHGFADGGEVPRSTTIAGQPHYLAYINPEEGDLLKGLGGAEAPGPGGIPSYWFHSGWGGGSSSSSSSSSSNDDNKSSSGGLLNDLAMGFGLKEKDQSYVDRTAATIERNQGSSAASNYASGMTDKGFDDNYNAPAATTTTVDTSPSTTVTTTPTSYVDTSSLAGISAASGVDYTGGNTNTTSFDNDSMGGGYEDAAYGGSQAGFYNDGGFGSDDDDDDSDNVVVTTPTYTDTSTLAGINAASGYTGDEFGTGNIFTEETPGGSTVDFGTGTNTTTFPDDPPPSVPDPVYVPPPTYYDMFGGEHATQEAANAADKSYSDAQQTALDVASQTDNVPGYMSGGYEYEGPDFDQEASNTAKLTGVDYSTISDDYSTFQGNDLSTGDGNTIGYSTGGSKVGYSAVVNPVTGGIDIYTPGSESIEKSFAAEELTEALNYLTDGDVDLTNLDAPADLLAGSVTGTETGDVGLTSGVDEIEDIIERLDTEGLDSFVDDSIETDFEVFPTSDGVVTRDEIEADLFGEDYTPTSAELAAQLEAEGLTNVTSGPLSVEEQIAQYDSERNLDLADMGSELLAGEMSEGEFESLLDEARESLDSGSEDVAGSFENLLNTQPVDQSQMDVIANTIRELEGFGSDTYFDVNAERAGYGSDTKTDPVTGEVTKIEPGMTVTKEEAEADLNRRLTQNTTLSDGTVQKGFIPSVVDAVGADTFYAMDPTTQAALTSIAYNYGANWAEKLPSLAEAAKTGNTDLIADAIEDRAVDNDGINATRRLREAEMVRSGVPLGGDTDIYAEDDVALAATATGKGTGVGGADTEIVTEVTGDTGQTATEAYLSAMKKVGSGYDPDSTDPNDPNKLTPMEQQALYGARGQTPNAAETAYLNALLRDAKHKEDGPIGEDGNPIYEAGDYVVQQTGAEQFGDLIVKGIDFFLNPLTILGDKYSLENMNESYVQEQLDAYKNGGTFVYDGAGTVVGIADANYDADGDGENDSVVLLGDDGEYTVTGGRIGVEDVDNSNQYSDTDEDIDDIDIVDSNTTYTNTEDGVVEERVGAGEEETGSDDSIDPCPEGFILDPVLGECVPIDEVDATTGTPSLGDVIRPDTGSGTPTPTPTPTPAPVDPMIIRGPKQFNVGGAVTPNIDRFMQSLGA